MFKVDKFNHVLTATFLIYTSLLCALYGYLLFQAVHEIENQSAQLYLQHAHTEVLERMHILEKDVKPSTPTDLMIAVVQYFKLSKPQLQIHTSLELQLADYLTELSPGFHEYHPDNVQILVSDVKNFILYLLYDESNATNLDQNTPDLIVGLTSVALLICFLGLLISILLSKKIAQPLRLLAEEVEKDNPVLPLIGHCRADEIGTLSRNFTTTIKRAQQFLVREQQFSRHVSHELRTPVAIISNCISLLKLENTTLEAKQTAINRIDRATHNMSDLIETFLLLGREPHLLPQSTTTQNIHLRALVLNELGKIELAIKEANYKHKVVIFQDANVRSEAALLGILINNLLRNALAFSATYVHVTLGVNRLKIENDIAELNEISSSGFGYGTEIINRIMVSLHCHAKVTTRAEYYCVEISFNP